MKLYHGTNQDIQKIDLSRGHKHKDFGQGFYLTSDISTAIRMARKKANLFGGSPVLIEYEFDEAKMNSLNLRCKCFPKKATTEWLRFVDKNRYAKSDERQHDYDMVIGPIADDGVVLQITNYHRGYITDEQAAIGLQDKYLDQQYYFGTEKSLSTLNKIKTIIIE